MVHALMVAHGIVLEMRNLAKTSLHMIVEPDQLPLYLLISIQIEHGITNEGKQESLKFKIKPPSPRIMLSKGTLIFIKA